MATTTLKLFDPADTRPGESLSGIIHVCDLCGRAARWNDDWTWYGSVADQDAGIVLELCGCTRLTDKKADALLAEKRIRLGRPAKVRRERSGDSW